ncbi:MAG: hypothetical protein Kilf2KO_20570 [Rhodospirillales bacterium]
MTWPTMILVFFIIWWVVLFAVLPWGARPPERSELGHASSAPERPMLWRKAAATTGITIVLFLIAYWLIESDFLSFRVPPR